MPITIKENHGMIIAVRIFNDNRCTPFAELRWTDGTVNVIQWNKHDDYINAFMHMNSYTLFYDERNKREWTSW